MGRYPVGLVVQVVEPRYVLRVPVLRVAVMLVAMMLVTTLPSCNRKKVTKKKPTVTRSLQTVTRAPTDFPLRAPLVGSVTIAKTLRGAPAEPSGATFFPELNGFLVVDDESLQARQRGLHFLQFTNDTNDTNNTNNTNDTNAELTATPVVLGPSAARYQWDDLEGVAINDTHVYWIASHEYNSTLRQRLCYAPRKSFVRKKDPKGNLLIIIDSVTCNADRALRRKILAALGLGANQPKLNIEGFTWDPTARVFLLGIRAPLVNDKAAVLAMDVNQKGTITTPHLTRKHLLNLEGRGIRAITSIPNNRLIVAAGPVDSESTRFDLYLHNVSDSTTRLLTPNGFPTFAEPAHRELKIEGLANTNTELLIFCDSGTWSKAGTVEQSAHYYSAKFE